MNKGEEVVSIKYLKDDLESLRLLVERDLESQMEGGLRDDDMAEFRREKEFMLEECKRLLDLLGEIKPPRSYTSKIKAKEVNPLQLLTGVNLLDASANRISAMVQTTSGKTGGWFSSTFIPLLKKVMASTWNLICHLLTPTSWEIEGTLGSSLLGLGSVKVKIKFG